MWMILVLGLIIMGLVAGWMAGYVLHNGGRGLAGDLGFGVLGSLPAVTFVWAMGLLAIEPALLLILAFVGAGLVIGAQRLLWPAHIR